MNQNNQPGDVGWRYLRWDQDVAPTLSASERARTLEAFAVEFGDVSPVVEPYPR